MAGLMLGGSGGMGASAGNGGRSGSSRGDAGGSSFGGRAGDRSHSSGSRSGSSRGDAGWSGFGGGAGDRGAAKAGSAIGAITRASSVTRTDAVGTVGILVADRPGEPGFASEAYHRQLCEAGERLGLDVYVVTPETIVGADVSGGGSGDAAGRGLSGGAQAQLHGFRPAPGGGWRRTAVPVPDCVYDRHFAAGPAERARCRTALRRLAAAGSRLLGGGLPGKRAVQRMLARDGELAPHLPPTARLGSAQALLAALDRRGELFLKPDGGSQGRGAFLVGAMPACVETLVRGRTPAGEPFARRFAGRAAFTAWLRTAVGRRPYLIQPYLSLYDRDGAAFDIRCLMQKDGSGSWSCTGIAVRRGRPDSVTANLHGGGTAEAAEPFLAREYGRESAAAIMASLRRLALRVPAVLEAQCGRLLELGLDFGVDRSGRVWLIEANSKPGRAAFAHIGSPGVRRAAVENPLRYARTLLTAPGRRRRTVSPAQVQAQVQA